MLKHLLALMPLSLKARWRYNKERKSRWTLLIFTPLSLKDNLHYRKGLLGSSDRHLMDEKIQKHIYWQ